MADWFGSFSDWAWARHHNEWSWYIRGLIIIAFCGAAWRRNLLMLVALALFFPISAFIFPAPEVPKPYVVAFLEAERAMLENLSLLQFVAFLTAVIVFLALLAAAFWHRSLIYGILVANLGGCIKLAFGYWAWGDAGSTALMPTLATAAIFNGFFLALWLVRRRRAE